VAAAHAAAGNPGRKHGPSAPHSAHLKVSPTQTKRLRIFSLSKKQKKVVPKKTIYILKEQ